MTHLAVHMPYTVPRRPTLIPVTLLAYSGARGRGGGAAAARRTHGATIHHAVRRPRVQLPGNRGRAQPHVQRGRHAVRGHCQHAAGAAVEQLLSSFLGSAQRAPWARRTERHGLGTKSALGLARPAP
eukprot:365143-Chlamydomonas_euryale.AAC.1